MRRKSVAVAYVLWLISGFGWLGFHRLYLGKKKYYWLWILSVGYFMIGSIYDLFTISKQCKNEKTNAQKNKTRATKSISNIENTSSQVNVEDSTISAQPATEGYSQMDNENPIESNRNPFPFSAKGFYKVWERLNERICLFEEKTGKIDFYKIHKNEDVTFEFEPDNSADPDAVRVLVDGKFIGYLYRDSGVRRQVYKLDADSENLKFCAQISFVNRMKPELQIRFALYQRFNPSDFKFLGSYNLVRTSKKIDDYENRQDNYVLSGLDTTDAIIQIEQDLDEEDNEIYIAYAPNGGEIGELPISATKKLEGTYPLIIIGILEEVIETDSEKYIASIKIYYR